MLPSPSELLGFLEIAESLNITKAAQRLGVTQPTLSQSLKKLESTLGVQLVNRSKNGVDLTIAGKEFLKHARRLVEQWEEIKSRTQKSTQEVRGTVKIGAHPSVALYSMGSFLPELIRTHAQLEISLYHDLSRVVVDKIINYEIDIGLVINPTRHVDLVLQRVSVDEVKIWKHRDSISDVLILHPELLQTQDILKKLKRGGDEYKRVITSASLEVITALTLKGAGHGIIPAQVVNAFDRDKVLKPIAHSPVFKDELFIAHRIENKDVKTIRTIKEAMIEFLG